MKKNNNLLKLPVLSLIIINILSNIETPIFLKMQGIYCGYSSKQIITAVKKYEIELTYLFDSFLEGKCEEFILKKVDRYITNNLSIIDNEKKIINKMINLLISLGIIYKDSYLLDTTYRLALSEIDKIKVKEYLLKIFNLNRSSIKLDYELNKLLLRNTIAEFEAFSYNNNQGIKFSNIVTKI